MRVACAPKSTCYPILIRVNGGPEQEETSNCKKDVGPPDFNVEAEFGVVQARPGAKLPWTTLRAIYQAEHGTLDVC